MTLISGAHELEQFARAERYLGRIRRIYEGVLLSARHDKDGYEDDLISFFMHCYHIRDWILHLNKAGVSAAQLDDFINNNEVLRVCADLCNGSKHCKLTRKPRSGLQPHVAGKSYQASTWFVGSGGGEVLQAKYSVVTSTGAVDALDLAEECLHLWREFILEMSRTVNP